MIYAKDRMEIDILALEEALREVSRGTMVAPLRDVVQVASERWGYPGTERDAAKAFFRSGNYVVEGLEDFAAAVVAPTLG